MYKISLALTVSAVLISLCHSTTICCGFSLVFFLFLFMFCFCYLSLFVVLGFFCSWIFFVVFKFWIIMILLMG